VIWYAQCRKASAEKSLILLASVRLSTGPHCLTHFDIGLAYKTVRGSYRARHQPEQRADVGMRGFAE
jgi:hypothetical protein